MSHGDVTSKRDRHYGRGATELERDGRGRIGKLPHMEGRLLLPPRGLIEG